MGSSLYSAHILLGIGGWSCSLPWIDPIHESGLGDEEASPSQRRRGREKPSAKKERQWEEFRR